MTNARSLSRRVAIGAATSALALGAPVVAATPAGAVAHATVSDRDVPARAVEDGAVVAYLSSSQEVPRNSSDAWGWSVWRIHDGGSRIDYSATLFDLENVVGAHLHVAPRGANGGIVVNLLDGEGPFPLAPGGGPFGRLEGSITADDLEGALAGASMADLLAAIDGGEVYVNVHTDDGEGDQGTGPGDLAGGEVRGQLVRW